jgi:hypothetical protein
MRKTLRTKPRMKKFLYNNKAKTSPVSSSSGVPIIVNKSELINASWKTWSLSNSENVRKEGKVIPIEELERLNVARYKKTIIKKPIKYNVAGKSGHVFRIQFPVETNTFDRK